MAKLGTYTAKWSKEISTESGAVRYDIALRSNGSLVEKRTFLRPDGSKHFDTGWKVKARKAKPLHQLRDILEAAGYVERGV